MWRRWHRWCTYKPRNAETANNTPWTAAHQASLSITNSRSLLKLVHRVGDAIQPSHPLSSPSPPTFNLSQHQDLFQWVSSSHQLAKVLELQHQSFQWVNIQDWFPLGLTDWSPCSPRDTQDSSPTPEFKSINSSVLSFLYDPTHAWLLEKPYLWLEEPLSAK